MTIRLSRHSDIERLEQVERSAAQKFKDFLKLGQEFSEHTLPVSILMAAHESQTLWIAADNNDLAIGFLAATPLDGNLHIHELSVARDWQGKGLGRDLIDGIKTHSRQNNIPKVTLTTDKLIPWNKPFYEKLGFVEIPLSNCGDELGAILIRDKSHSPVPDNRIAMIFKAS